MLGTPHICMFTTGSVPGPVLTRTGKKWPSPALPCDLEQSWVTSMMSYSEAEPYVALEWQRHPPDLPPQHQAPLDITTIIMTGFRHDSCVVPSLTPLALYVTGTHCAFHFVARTNLVCILVPRILQFGHPHYYALLLPGTSQHRALPTGLDQLVPTTPKLPVPKDIVP